MALMGAHGRGGVPGQVDRVRLVEPGHGHGEVLLAGRLVAEEGGLGTHDAGRPGEVDVGYRAA